MSKFSENIEKKADKKLKDRTRREKLASYFYDVSKLIIAGVVIGGITPMFKDEHSGVEYTTVLLGTITSVFFAWIGNKILK